MDLGIIIIGLGALYWAIRRDIMGLKPIKKKAPVKAAEEGNKEEYVYIVCNPSFSPGIFKIGLTRGEVDKRMKSLYTTGVPTPFRVCAVIKTDDCVTLEKKLHSQYALARINNRREFFRLTEQSLGKILEEHRSDIDFISHYNIDRAFKKPAKPV